MSSINSILCLIPHPSLPHIYRKTLIEQQTRKPGTKLHLYTRTRLPLTSSSPPTFHPDSGCSIQTQLLADCKQSGNTRPKNHHHHHHFDSGFFSLCVCVYEMFDRLTLGRVRSSSLHIHYNFRSLWPEPIRIRFVPLAMRMPLPHSASIKKIEQFNQCVCGYAMSAKLLIKLKICIILYWR